MTERRVVIAGGSMAPTLDIGDVALLREGARVRCGDVAAFRSRGQVIVHRVVLVIPWRGGARMIHRGDALGAGYGVVGASEVLGRVVAVERAAGREPMRRHVRPLDLLRAAANLGTHLCANQRAS